MNGNRIRYFYDDTLVHEGKINNSSLQNKIKMGGKGSIVRYKVK